MKRFPRWIGSASGTLLLISTVLAQPVESPLKTAVRVADRTVAETTFDFVPRLQRGEQDGFYTLDFFDTFGATRNAVYYARALIEVDSAMTDDELGLVRLGLSLSPGEYEIRVGDQIVYSGQTATPERSMRLDYDLVRPMVSLDVPLLRGEQRLWVKAAPDSLEAIIRVGFLRGDNELTVTGVHLKPPGMPDPPESIRFLVIGPFDADSSALVTQHAPDSVWLDLRRDYVGKYRQPVRWDVPRVHLVRDHPERLDYSDWRYFTGTFLDAMYALSDVVESRDYSGYIGQHLDFFLNHRAAVTAERKDYSLLESAFGHYFRYSLLDDMGMQAVPFAERTRRSDEVHPEDVAIAAEAANYVLYEAKRLADGTFARLNPDSLTVWADDLFMGSVILVRAAAIFGEPDYLTEAAQQAIDMHRYLYEPESGLYWHGYFDRTSTPSSSKWGRANGWTMMAKTEILKALPEDHPLRAGVLNAFVTHAAGLLAFQSADGRWHQVLDNPDTYLETSCTAMFVRAFAEGVANGWLPEDGYREAALRGWKALTRQVRPDGMVEGIVRGTPIFYSDEEYDQWGTRLHDPRGVGAMIYAAVAVDRLLED